MARTHTALASLLAVTAAAAPAAIGAPVVFYNSNGGFEWYVYGQCSGSLITDEYLFLDVTRPLELQARSDEEHNNCFGRPPHTVSRFDKWNGLNNPVNQELLASGNQAIAFSAPISFQLFPGAPLTTITPPRVYADGEEVGPTADWTPDTPGNALRYVGAGATATPLATGSGAWGFRFTIDGQLHYAFVAFKLHNNAVWVPLTWGYESEPNTPIAVVVPACLTADLNRDRTVNLDDLVMLLGSFGNSGLNHYSSDINGDLTVNTADLVRLLSNYGCSL